MGDIESCTYCGDPADTLDHLEPISRQTNRRRRGKMASCGKRVPCCRLCNSLLGASDAFTVRERAAFLLMAYARHDRRNPLAIAGKMQHLLHVAAGFPLPEQIEAMEAERRRDLAEQIAARRALEEERELEEAREMEEASAAQARQDVERQARQAGMPEAARARWVSDAELEEMRRHIAQKRGTAPSNAKD